MVTLISADRLRFYLNRLKDQLWIKPMVVCLMSIAAAFVAKLADGTGLAKVVPAVEADSIETLLSIMGSSMLVIATFSVASMVSAYASASSTATPRSFSLVVSDDASKNALSTFLGAFIFSAVGLTAMMNESFGKAGLFVLFVLTAAVFAVVIFTFLRWVDRIARLGRMGNTIDRVEQATADAFKRRRKAPTLMGKPVGDAAGLRAVCAQSVGYVQHIDMAALQAWAEKTQGRVVVSALPGTFAAPGRTLAYIDVAGDDADLQTLLGAFNIGGDRLFNDDPRFGLVVLSEIAGRALSPAVNDPGTAIDVVGTLVRLFTVWNQATEHTQDATPEYSRVEVPELSVADMFDDAFTAIARDGAGTVEVGVRLQKALYCLGTLGDVELRAAAAHHSRLALKRAALALTLPEDLQAVEAAARLPVA